MKQKKEEDNINCAKILHKIGAFHLQKGNNEEGLKRLKESI